MKKKIAIVLSVLLVLAFGSIAYAADKTDAAVSKAPAAPGSEVKEFIENDPEILAKLSEEEGLTAPEGQKLVSVKTTVVTLASAEEPQKVAPMATKAITVGGVATVGYRYYSDDYDSYWYYGPYNLSATFGQTRNAGYSSSVSVSSSLVSAAVGFSVTSSYYKTGSHSASVPSGQSLNLRVHTNYLVKSFKVYNSGAQIGSGTAWRPYSLIFREYWYA